MTTHLSPWMPPSDVRQEPVAENPQTKTSRICFKWGTCLLSLALAMLLIFLAGSLYIHLTPEKDTMYRGFGLLVFLLLIPPFEIVGLIFAFIGAVTSMLAYRTDPLAKKWVVRNSILLLLIVLQAIAGTIWISWVN